MEKHIGVKYSQLKLMGVQGIGTAADCLDGNLVTLFLNNWVFIPGHRAKLRRGLGLVSGGAHWSRCSHMYVSSKFKDQACQEALALRSSTSFH